MISFSNQGWEEYNFWLENDQKVFEKIRRLIRDTQREPFRGIGKPEPLKNNLSGYWSRRITDEHRFVYKITNDGLIIISCRFHY